MHAETDLVALLRRLSPQLREGAYVYTIVSDAIPPGAVPVVFVREDEGLTLVLPQQQADDLGLPYNFVAAWITLQVHSPLSGLIAKSASMSGSGWPKVGIESVAGCGRPRTR